MAGCAVPLWMKASSPHWQGVFFWPMVDDAIIPEYTAEFDIEQFDLRNVFAYAQATKKTAYDVLKERNYPVFKFFTGGDGIVGGAVAGPGVEAFRFDEASGLFEPVSKAAATEANPIITLTASTTAVDMVGD